MRKQAHNGTTPVRDEQRAHWERAFLCRLPTLQLKRLVRLNPTKLRQTDVRASIRAVRYTANDHFHGRLPVNTSHSKSRVVKNSHLRQAAVSIVESVGDSKIEAYT
jgi:hypothetical protein